MPRRSLPLRRVSALLIVRKRFVENVHGFLRFLSFLFGFDRAMGAMGAMGAASTGVSRGCALKTSRAGTKVTSLAMEDDPIRKTNAEGQGLEDECVVSEWWGNRALMKRTDAEEKKCVPILALPDDLMTLVFAQLPRQSLGMARLVCSSWKRVAEQQELASLRRKIGVAEGWIFVLAETPEGAPFRAYDPIAAKWCILPPTPGRSEGQRWQGFACVALGHRVLLMGGTRSQVSPTSGNYSSGVVCSDVVIYDALTNKWSKGANMNTPRSWAAAAVVGDKVYVAGGQGNTKFLDSAEVYDPESDTWKTISSMTVVRSSCQGVALEGQFWVIAGEYVRNHYDDNQKRSAEVYDAETDSWRFVPNMCLDDNKVMEPSAVVNGELICVHHNRIMAYKKDSNTWSQLGHVNGGAVYARPYSRFGFACESVGSNLYIIGGTRVCLQNRHRYNTPLNTVEVCDLRFATHQSSSQLWWTLGADMSRSQGIVSASTVAWL